MPYCEVEKDVRLYYEAFGSGEPIVFVHGGGMSHEGWEQQVFELADHFHCVAYDLRGHGESDKPAHGNNFERFTQDLEALLAHLRLDRVSLVCHAVGGYVGMQFALRNPNALHRLVLVSSGARFIGEDAERGGFSHEFWNDYLSGLKESKIEATAKLVNQMFFHRDPGEATRQEILSIMMQWPLYSMKEIGRDAQNIDFKDRLQEIKAPTLIVHGAHDRKQRYSGAAHLCDSIPNARLVTFEDSAHLPNLEEVERFNRVVMEFVKEGQTGAAQAVA